MTNAAMAPAITRDFSLQVYSRISYPGRLPGPHARQQAMAFLPGGKPGPETETDFLTWKPDCCLEVGRRRALASSRHVITAYPFEFHIARS
jgi:hypothetical protein